MKLFTAISIIAAFVWLDAASADQTTISNYNAARTIFWNQGYPGKPEGTPYSDLYRGFNFRTRDDVEMQVEHVYPANWFGTAFGCGTREQCRATSERFNRIEADLHILWPSEKNANGVRSNHSFTIIQDENWDFENCDMEKADSTFYGTPVNSVIEPRKISRGNIARSIFYMVKEYDLPIEERLIPLLKAWNAADKVSSDGRRRNGLIEQIQGMRNAFIGSPNAIESGW